MRQPGSADRRRGGRAGPQTLRGQAPPLAQIAAAAVEAGCTSPAVLIVGAVAALDLRP